MLTGFSVSQNEDELMEELDEMLGNKQVPDLPQMIPDLPQVPQEERKLTDIHMIKLYANLLILL